MSNELLFVTVMIVDLAFVLLCFKLGKEFLYVAVISNIMFTNMVSSKLINVFGFDSTVANVFYAAIFLATDLLAEHHGHRSAVRAVWMGFVALVPIIIFAPFVNLFSPSVFAGTDVSDALNVIFGYTPRIAVASLVAYIIAQRTDVFFFEYIRKRRPGKRWLWARNNGSTMLSQFLDQGVFVTLAFAGAVPNSVLMQIFISGYIIKVIVAVSDTPVVYLSYLIKPRDAARSSER